MPKIQFNAQNGFFYITLPKRVVEVKGWQKGDFLEVREDKKGNLVLIHEKKH